MQDHAPSGGSLEGGSPSETSPGEALLIARRQMAAADGLTDLQVRFRGDIDRFLVEHGPIALTRECLRGHLTASCLVWDDAGERVLLHHHRKLRLWLQFGGHCDGDGDLARVALRETVEESGIEPSFMTPRPIDFDIHAIPARPAKGARAAEPKHLHLDVRFLAVAPPRARASISDESLAMAWLTPAEALSKGIDESLVRMLALGPPQRH